MLVPVLTAVQKRVASGFSRPKVALRLCAVGEHVGDEKGGRGVEDGPCVGVRLRPVVRRSGLQRAAGGERAVRADQLPEADVGRAERERRAVELGALAQAVEAECAQPVDEGVAADESQRAHGGRVERRGQRGAHRDQAAEPVVVVLRDDTARRRAPISSGASSTSDAGVSSRRSSARP